MYIIGNPDNQPIKAVPIELIRATTNVAIASAVMAEVNLFLLKYFLTIPKIFLFWLQNLPEEYSEPV